MCRSLANGGRRCTTRRSYQQVSNARRRLGRAEAALERFTEAAGEDLDAAKQARKRVLEARVEAAKTDYEAATTHHHKVVESEALSKWAESDDRVEAVEKFVASGKSFQPSEESKQYVENAIADTDSLVEARAKKLFWDRYGKGWDEIPEDERERYRKEITGEAESTVADSIADLLLAAFPIDSAKDEPTKEDQPAPKKKAGPKKKAAPKKRSAKKAAPVVDDELGDLGDDAAPVDDFDQILKEFGVEDDEAPVASASSKGGNPLFDDDDEDFEDDEDSRWKDGWGY